MAISDRSRGACPRPEKEYRAGHTLPYMILHFNNYPKTIVSMATLVQIQVRKFCRKGCWMGRCSQQRSYPTWVSSGLMIWCPAYFSVLHSISSSSSDTKTTLICPPCKARMSSIRLNACPDETRETSKKREHNTTPVDMCLTQSEAPLFIAHAILTTMISVT